MNAEEIIAEAGVREKIKIKVAIEVSHADIPKVCFKDQSSQT